MPAPICPKIRAQVIALRRQGYGFAAIRAEITKTNPGAVSIGSVGNILRDVVFTPEEQTRIDAFYSESRFRAAATKKEKYGEAEPKPKASKAKWTDEERAAIKSKTLYDLHLTYSDKQLPIKELLEKKHKAKFHKEFLEDILVPYASRKFIIFVGRTDSHDHKVIQQLAAVCSMQDRRKKIVYLAKPNGKAAARAKKLGAEVYHSYPVIYA